MKRTSLLLPLLALAACEGTRQDHSKVLAKIGGTSYTQTDFEFMLKTATPEHQAEVLNDPEQKRKQFNYLLKQKLMAMASQKAPYGKNPALLARLETIDKRIVTQHYYQAFLGEQGGFPMKELEAFYQSNSGRFPKDSAGKAKPLEAVKTQVADSLIISKAPLDSFYQANLKKYEQKAYCEVSLIQTSSRKSAGEAAKAVEGGMAFGDAAQKYSNHAGSKASQGKLGRLTKGESLYELQGVNVDSLFFSDDTRLKPGAVSRPIKKDTNYLVVKADTCRPTNTPPLAEIRQQVSEDYLTQYKSKLSEGALARLKAKYGVKQISLEKPVDPAELSRYFEAHKDNYNTAESYEVYHVESKRQDQLARQVKGIKDVEAFKKLAGRISDNAWTKPNGGLVGVIKKDHCLPYGIGMMPSLFPMLDTMTTGATAAIQNPDTKKWHAFWLVKKMPRQPKPFDRVKGLVAADFKSERTNTVKPADTLAVYDKNKLIREKDVLFLREEIPAHLQERYTREALVDFLLTWDLANMEAKQQGLTDDVKLKAQRLENQINFWAGTYQDSVLSKTAGLDTADLKRVFAQSKPYFTKDDKETDYKKYSKDIAGFVTLDAKELEIEYKTNPERYKRDTVALSFEESRFDVYMNLKNTAYNRADERQLDRLKREFQVVILDPALLGTSLANPQESYKLAQNMHYDRKLDAALELYEKLRDRYPKMESLQDSICFGMAQIYIEQEKYQQALSEYRRLSYLYPKSPNNYKAMFMVGFIFAEHLKNDSSAVKSFERMLAQYPSSDLSDDADWMIRNIRSGGKLMPVLEGDSGFAATDSTAAAAPGDSVASTGSGKSSGGKTGSKPPKSN